MNYKVDIGNCKIAIHPVEIDPGAVPHREGVRRMTPEKAEKAANQEVRDFTISMGKWYRHGQEKDW